MSREAIVREEHGGALERERARPIQHLTFTIAGESYAISVLQVREILRFETITRVPLTPRSVRGVINLRGNVVPVVDLAVKFGLSESPISKGSCIVIVETDLGGEQTVMGVMADSVNQVIDFLPGDIEPPPPFGTNVRTDFLVGMGRDQDKFVLILDIDQVLTAEEITTASILASAEEGIAAGGEPERDLEGSAAELLRTNGVEPDELLEEWDESEEAPAPSDTKMETPIRVEAGGLSETETADSEDPGRA